MIEEFEAATWYQERIDACRPRVQSDPGPHATRRSMRPAAEWIRRNDWVQAKELKDYMFTEGPIPSIEGAGQA